MHHRQVLLAPVYGMFRCSNMACTFFELALGRGYLGCAEYSERPKDEEGREDR